MIAWQVLFEKTKYSKPLLPSFDFVSPATLNCDTHDSTWILLTIVHLGNPPHNQIKIEKYSTQSSPIARLIEASTRQDYISQSAWCVREMSSLSKDKARAIVEKIGRKNGYVSQITRDRLAVTEPETLETIDSLREQVGTATKA